MSENALRYIAVFQSIPVLLMHFVSAGESSIGEFTSAGLHSEATGQAGGRGGGGQHLPALPQKHFVLHL